jgi:secondary thiamine-phosphate synthase enzyme
MVYRKHIQIHTSGHGDVHDLSDAVLRVVEQSRIECGVAHLFVIGSTGAVGTMEFEPGLQADLPDILDRLIPPGRHYQHEQAWGDGNAHSHLQATLLGASLGVPVESGRLILGTYQQIVFVECDTRPRERTLVVTVVGETARR